MATVKMTADVITSITGRVRELYEADREKIDHTLPEIPKGFAEWLYSFIFPKDAQEKVREALPEWYSLEKKYGMSIRMATNGNSSWRNTPVLEHSFEEPQLHFNRAVSRENLPGITAIAWNGSVFSVVFEEDISAIPSRFQDYVKKLTAIPQAHDKITRASAEAAKVMASFLKQHTTLQKAIKVFGPALNHYFDPWVRMQLEAKPPPRVRKPKEEIEKMEVDISKLVARAAADKLNI